MSVAPLQTARGTRLTALVSDDEAEAIARRAEAAGLSVSAYLRDRALGKEDGSADEAALRQVDSLIDRITADLDVAIAEIAAVNARLAAA